MYSYEEFEKLSLSFKNNFLIARDKSNTSEVRDSATINANNDIFNLSRYVLYSLFSSKFKSKEFNINISDRKYNNKQFYLIKYNDTNAYFVEPRVGDNDNLLYELIYYMKKANNNELNIYELYSVYSYLSIIIKEKIDTDSSNNSMSIVYDYNIKIK